MKRRLFNVLAGASLALCVATAALWIRSYSAADRWQVTSDRVVRFLFRTNLGEIDVGVGNWWLLPPNPEQMHVSEPTQARALSSFGTFRRNLWHVIWFPIWLPFIVFAIVPTYWLLRPRRRPGLCLHCGYDLRATPDRCPECGTVPKMTA